MAMQKKVIDQNQFEQLCQIQCTKDEICAVLDVSDKTLDRWCKETYKTSFSDIFRQKRQGGCASLRAKQWKLASKSPAMAIFLGKQFLGQTDKVETHFDASEVNAINKAMITDVAKERSIEDFE